MKRKLKVRTIRYEAVASFVCNKCRKKITVERKYDPTMNSAWLHDDDSLSLSFTAGYDSPWGDCTIVELDFCKECVYELLGYYR